MLFFGVSGGVVFGVGFVVGVVALVLRFGYGIGFRPLLDLVMVLVVSRDRAVSGLVSWGRCWQGRVKNFDRFRGRSTA